MVKANPRMRGRLRQSMKRHRLEEYEKAHHLRLLKLATFSSPQSLKQQPAQEPQPKSATSALVSSLSPSPSKLMKRPRSPSSSSHYSPLPSSYHSSQSHSLSYSSSPTTKRSNSTPSRDSTFLCAMSPVLSSLPPLPPPSPPMPSPNLLRRTVSGPVHFLRLPSSDNKIILNSPKSSSPLPVPRNSPQASSLSTHLRRTISEPVTSLSPNSKVEKGTAKVKEEAVEVEALSGEWIVVKFKCECSIENHYLVDGAGKKCFKLV